MSKTQNQMGELFLHCDLGENRIEHGNVFLSFRMLEEEIHQKFQKIVDRLNVVHEGEVGETFEISLADFLEMKKLIQENRKIYSERQKKTTPQKEKNEYTGPERDENGNCIWDSEDAKL